MSLIKESMVINDSRKQQGLNPISEGGVPLVRLVDTFDLERVGGYLKREPNCNVIIIANNRKLSDEYWNRIQKHLGINKRAFIVTNSNNWDGLPIIDSLVLKIGRWWENKNARDFMHHTSLAKLSLPITFIPPFMKGGEDD